MRPRRGAVHPRLGHEQRPRWSPDGEDRVRQPARRSQLHRHLRRRDALAEVHGARRGSSTRARRGRRTASGSRSSAARARRSVSRRSRAAAASDCRTARRSTADECRTRRRSGRRRWPSGWRRRQGGGGRAHGRRATPRRTSRRRRRSARADARDVPRRLHAVDVVGDPVTGEARVWHTRPTNGDPRPRQRLFTNSVPSTTSSGPDEHVVFTVTVPTTSGSATSRCRSPGPPTVTPTLLTTTDGIIEDATSVALSKDGKTLYYTTNARRHRSAPHLGGADGGRHAEAASRPATASRRSRCRSRRASASRR